MSRRFLIAFGFTVLIVGPVVAQTTAPPSSERVKEDSSRATPAGATFTVPAGWTLTTKAAMVVLEPPEPDSHVVIVDVKAKDADAAVAAAWAAYKPDFKRPLKIALPQAAREGWEEQKVFQYETSPNERAVVVAYASRAGDAWTVVLVDGTEPTFEKRGAPLRLALQSLRPKGYTRESFAGKKANQLDEKRLAILRGIRGDWDEAARHARAWGWLSSTAERRFGRGVWASRSWGRPDPVGADTLFIAASNTKALTTLLLAELVDEGKMRWDQPVTELFPAFKLGDEATTRQVQVQHLICACTGMPRQDMEWLFEYRNETPAIGDEAPGDDAAHQPLRRGLPVQQSDGGSRRVSSAARRRCPGRSGERPTTKRCGRKSSSRSG